MRIRPWLSLALGLTLATGAWPVAVPAHAQSESPAVRNVILMIGDGMGLPIVGAAELASRTQRNRSLALTRLYQEGAMGLAFTGSANSMITDSAAAATTLATGVKTKNGYIGMGPDDRDLLTVSEAALQNGKRVGLVTTTRISHATPAAFSALQNDRDEENAIAEQQLSSGVHLLLGGGARHYLPRDIAGSKRKDDRDLVSEAWSKGYQVIRTRQELLETKGEKLLGLFNMDHLSYQVDKPKETEPSLAEMTSKALQVLDRNPKGFFLMVEGGKIDHALHSNDGAAAIAELLAFDDAVDKAWEYQKQHPETLLVVTSDHDTGGFTVIGQQKPENPRSIRYPAPNDMKVLARVERSLESMIPELTKATTLAELKQIIKTHAGVDVDNEWLERVASRKAWMKSFNYHETAAIAAGEQHVMPFGFTTSSHTASPVLIGAAGPAPLLEQLSKPQENSEIGRLLVDLMSRR
jgi:alkaline phosphatase